MPSAQKPAGAEDAERALSRDQPVAADAAAPTPANQGSASAAGAEFTDEDLQQDPLGNGDLLRWRRTRRAEAAGGLDWIGTRQRTVVRRLQLTGVGAGMGGGGGREEG